MTFSSLSLSRLLVSGGKTVWKTITHPIIRVHGTARWIRVFALSVVHGAGTWHVLQAIHEIGILRTCWPDTVTWNLQTVIRLTPQWGTFLRRRRRRCGVHTWHRRHLRGPPLGRFVSENGASHRYRIGWLMVKDINLHRISTLGLNRMDLHESIRRRKRGKIAPNAYKKKLDFYPPVNFR